MTDRIVPPPAPGMSPAEVAQLKAEAAARGCEVWIDACVTEVSVPSFGDGGVQRLHSQMKEPERELEAES